MKSARYTLGLLLVVYVVNHIDRQVMYILAESVKIDLALSDLQLGMLTGGGVAVFYTLAGFPIARIADRGNRRNIIVVALLIWSAMTVASGLARNFGQLLFARIGVGVGEAGCTPPAHSIISDTFPPERRATALSVYALGVPIGTLFGLAAGGYLAEELGWKIAFIVVGVPGVLLALIVKLTLKEPHRGRFDAGADIAQESLKKTIKFILALPSMRHVLIATSMQTLFLAGVGAFHAAYLQRVHQLPLSEVGIKLGLIAGVAGGISVYGGGWLADRLGQRDLRWHFWIPAIGVVASLPFSYVAYSTNNVDLCLAMIAVASLLNHAYSGLSHAITQGLVKPGMRAVMSASALFMMNIVGVGMGPILVGALSDYYGARPEGSELLGIQSAMITLIIFIAYSVLHYLLGARTYARDLEAKSA